MRFPLVTPSPVDLLGLFISALSILAHSTVSVEIPRRSHLVPAHASKNLVTITQPAGSDKQELSPESGTCQLQILGHETMGPKAQLLANRL